MVVAWVTVQRCADVRSCFRDFWQYADTAVRLAFSAAWHHIVRLPRVNEAPSVAADVVMEAARDFGKRANRADKFGYGEEVTRSRRIATGLVRFAAAKMAPLLKRSCSWTGGEDAG